jgi:hypothetical protein
MFCHVKDFDILFLIIKKVACSRQLPYRTFVTLTFMSIIIAMSINPFGLSLSCGRSVRVLVLNATFTNISVIPWWSVLLVVET